MKTIVKLKRDMAALVFTDKGCQLVYPERPEGEELPKHFALAASVATAIQYEGFVNAMLVFVKSVVEPAEEKGSTH